ncbi:MAG: TPM domain-containing protein [Nitrospirae bacterium]|nr:TPM domain-containing protein [Nitrospirota bacterium]
MTFFLLVLLSFFTRAPAAEVSIPDTPVNYVVDTAGIIDDASEEMLNGYLRELEEKATAQMAVLTIKSLEGASIEDFSLNVAHNKWRLGQKGKDNGVLLLVSVEDREYRIEVGYGLESILPDSLAGSIGRQYLIPYFRKGDYSAGIINASLAVIKVISTDAGIEITGMPDVRMPAAGRKRIDPVSSAFSLIFLIFIIYMFIRHPRLLLLFIMMNTLGGGRRSGWGGGGGFSGGGGFGGGSGGFGGGGASGRW